jgi:catechol 2,3-dioxygenase-like lactoylglutathione lyase family enzyme
MFARIGHVAIYTENYEKMANFYKSIFGMKQITEGMRDDSGQRKAELGHVSDGVIGLALLRRNAGIRSGLDHFGFEVKDIQTVLDRIGNDYPDLLVKNDLRGLSQVVPFAEVRAQDPVGTHFDISQEGTDEVREGYADGRWDQPRHFSHVAIRALKPDLLAQFYKKVFELKEVESPPANGQICLTDGKAYLVIRPCHTDSYATMKQGLDHIGFKVESLAKVEDDLAGIQNAFPQSKPKKIAGGRFGDITLRELESCVAGQFGTADPDGVLVHLSE